MTSSMDFLNSQREKLLEEKTRIEEELKNLGAGSTGITGDFASEFPNIGDDQEENALEVQTYEQNLAVGHDLSEMLSQIKQALERIDRGEYTRCQQGDEIEEGRLKAIPWASTCVKHSH